MERKVVAIVLSRLVPCRGFRSRELHVVALVLNPWNTWKPVFGADKAHRIHTRSCDLLLHDHTLRKQKYSPHLTLLQPKACSYHWLPIGSSTEKALAFSC